MIVILSVTSNGTTTEGKWFIERLKLDRGWAVEGLNQNKHQKFSQKIGQT